MPDSPPPPESIVRGGVVDKALNAKQWFRSPVGNHPIPKGRYEVIPKDFRKQEFVLKEVMSIDTGYSIPYTPENMDKIYNKCLSTRGKTTYYWYTCVQTIHCRVGFMTKMGIGLKVEGWKNE